MKPSARLLIGIACLAVAAGSTACEEDEGPTCPRYVDEVLELIDKPAPGREQCGAAGAYDAEAIRDGLECFADADAEAGAELIIGRCIDCLITSTYVATPEGDVLHIYIEADHYGDDYSEVLAEQCDEVVENENVGVECVNPQKLYACNAPL